MDNDVMNRRILEIVKENFVKDIKHHRYLEDVIKDLLNSSVLKDQQGLSNLISNARLVQCKAEKIQVMVSEILIFNADVEN